MQADASGMFAGWARSAPGTRTVAQATSQSWDFCQWNRLRNEQQFSFLYHPEEFVAVPACQGNRENQ
jgi:hypothetical protein